MKKQLLKNKSGCRVYQLILAAGFCLTLLSSCRNNDNRLIPVKALVDILSEVYIADGMLSYPQVRSKFVMKDSTTNYIDIIEKHGFTKKRMDNTLRYYFDNNPKKLQNIYDQVLTRLNARLAILEKTLPPVQQPVYNLWNGKPDVQVPESGIKNPVWFSVPIKDTGTFILEFTATIYTDDQSINPRTTVFFWHTDSSKSEYRINWPETNLIKDIQGRNYSIYKRNTDTTYNHIGGWLLNCDPKEGRWEKHALIQSIRLRKAEIK